MRSVTRNRAVADNPERPLHTQRDTFEGEPNVQTDVATLALEPRARERRSRAGRVTDCRAPCDEGLRRRRRGCAREEGERVESRIATILADEAENDARVPSARVVERADRELGRERGG